MTSGGFIDGIQVEVVPLNSFKFQVVYAAPGTFTLPINEGGDGYAHNFQVNWGDGSPVSNITSYDDDNRVHTYAAAGTYIVTMVGTCEWFAFNNAGDKTKITQLIGFTGDMGFKILNFYGCSNLTSIVGLGQMAALTTADNIFHNCSSLSVIPTDCFRYATSVIGFLWAFANTTLTTLPTDCFRYNTLVTSFARAFYNCYLTTIPTDCFRYNILVTNFSYAFYYCSLTTIPTDCFKYNTLVTDFSCIFCGCYNLTTIPADCFRYNILVTTFSFAFQNAAIIAIPTDCFKYNILVTDFSFAFQNTGLTSIPTDCFRYNTLVTYFDSLFVGCSSLTSIPTDCFRYNTLVIDFSHIFLNCSNLTTVPADCFRYNTLVLEFSLAFYGCSALQQHSTIFYAAGGAATRFLNQTVNFTNCFSRGSFSGTQGTAPDLWNCNFGTGTPTTTGCWGGAGNSLTSLDNYGDIPGGWK